MNNTDREIEARFLEFNLERLLNTLREIGAEDRGEDFLKEIIFYDRNGDWQKGPDKKFVRLRKTKDDVFITFKHVEDNSLTGTREVELKTENFETARKFLEEIGLLIAREQEKKRHTFKLKDVVVDIDTWPQCPAYVELEAQEEKQLKEVAEQLKLDWSKAVFGSALETIEKYFHVPVSKFRHFTFSMVE